MEKCTETVFAVQHQIRDFLTVAVCWTIDIIRLYKRIISMVGPSMACFEISLSWLEPRYSHGVKAPANATVHRPLYSNMAAIGGQYRVSAVYIGQLSKHGATSYACIK